MAFVAKAPPNGSRLKFSPRMRSKLRLKSSGNGCASPMRTIPMLILPALLLGGCSSRQTSVLGRAPNAQPPTDVRLLSSQAGNVVTLEGEMVEKCPVAGCWFMLRDKTGIVRVDTKAAGFVVSEVPLHTKMTVSGIVAPGYEVGLKASGVRY